MCCRDLGRYYIDAIRPPGIRAWFAAKAAGYAPASANGFLRVLKTMMADASEEVGVPDPTPPGEGARLYMPSEEMTDRYSYVGADERAVAMIDMLKLVHGSGADEAGGHDGADQADRQAHRCDPSPVGGARGLTSPAMPVTYASLAGLTQW
jgi:hypothetical protein